jgi:hypothetical protein
VLHARVLDLDAGQQTPRPRHSHRRERGASSRDRSR